MTRGTSVWLQNSCMFFAWSVFTMWLIGWMKECGIHADSGPASFSVKGVRLGRWEEISVGSEKCSPQRCWLNFLLFAKHLEQPQWNLLEPGLWLQWGATFLLLSLLPVLISENLTHSSDRYRKLEAPEELRCPLESEKQAPDPHCHCHC